MDSNLLKSRICKGYTWLKSHGDDPHFPEALKLYEDLVDQAREQGIKETDCWPAEELSDKEILSLFDSPTVK